MPLSAKRASSQLDLNTDFKRKGRATNVTRGSGRRQAEKGAAMRADVLNATINCLATMPYSEVSTSLIADQAGVSRGGMQYYFPTRLDLLQATVAFLHAERLKIFRNDLLALEPDDDAIDRMIESHWRHLNEREFRAYQELVLAARSVPEIAEMLASSYRTFLDEWHKIARDIVS